MLTSVLGREVPVVLSPQEHQQCLSQLQGYRDLKLGLSCCHQCVQASCTPSLPENDSDDSKFSIGHFYLAILVTLKEKTACKSLELQKFPPLLPVLWQREDECLVGRRRGQLSCMRYFGDPFGPLLLELQQQRGAGRLWQGDEGHSCLVTDQWGSHRKRGDFSKRYFRIVFPCWWNNWACYYGGNKRQVLALPCTKARQSTAKEL